MKNFSKLINSLLYTNSRNKKIELIVNYFKITKDPERGYGLAVLTNDLILKNIQVSVIKKLVKKYVDEYYFDICYDYVGDLAETISLLWEEKNREELPLLSTIIKKLKKTNGKNFEIVFLDLLDKCSVEERWSLIKMITGGLRVGVSSKLAKVALSKYGNMDLNSIEKIWHGLNPPYTSLFNWLDRKAKIPKVKLEDIFHPMMLAHPIEQNDFPKLKPIDYIAEWKWDGVRVQIVIYKNILKIFSRTGEEITQTFPEIQIKSKELMVLDGELLVGNNFNPLSFNKLQQRLNRKKIVKKHLVEFPAFIKLYDILIHKDKDVREKSFTERRFYLENWHNDNPSEFFDLSEIINFSSWNELFKLKELRLFDQEREGLMIKKKNSCYLIGRPKGLWFKWKKEPKTVDVIMMYAQRGHGKRSSFYSDYTFGLWSNNDIIPVCKAYFGYNNNELEILDKFVRENTTKKFGPVREVKKALVVEIAFDSVHESKRHKSGVAMRFPRIKRLRLDKPVDEVLNIYQFKKIFNL